MLRPGMVSRYGGKAFPALGGQLWARYVAAAEAAHADGDPWLPQDVSPNGRHTTQATGSKKPLLKDGIVNGRAVYRLDGVDDFVDTPAATLNQPFAVFGVVKCRAAPVGSFGYLLDGATQDSTVWHQTDGGADLRMYAGVGGLILTLGTTVFHYAMCVFNGASSEAWLDGSLVASGNAGTQNAGGLRIGAQSGGAGANFAIFDVAELAVITGVPSSDVRTSLAEYAEAEYGL